MKAPYIAFSEEIADKIIDGLIEGKSLRKICAQKGMPNRSSVVRWQATNADFATKCAHAREEQADLMDDMILDTANNCTPATAQADKVKISAYQWRAAKLAPKRYGEKIETTLQGPDGGPVKTEVDLASALAFTLKKGLRVS